MALLKYATINLSKTELTIIQDLISKEKSLLEKRLDSRALVGAGQTQLKGVLESELQICKDLNFVLRNQLSKL